MKFFSSKVNSSMGFILSFFCVCFAVGLTGLGTGDPNALWGLLMICPLSWIWFGNK